jgi:hypothetical protein
MKCTKVSVRDSHAHNCNKSVSKPPRTACNQTSTPSGPMRRQGVPMHFASQAHSECADTWNNTSPAAFNQANTAPGLQAERADQRLHAYSPANLCWQRC